MLFISCLVLGVSKANEKIQEGCDSKRENNERDNFRALYKNARYLEAYNQLYFYVNGCKNSIPAPTLFWMQNDLALAMQKAGNPKECLNILSAIETNPDFSKASQALKSAVAFNKKNCTLDAGGSSKLEQPKGDKEYAWLLNKNLSTAKIKELFAKMLVQDTPKESPSQLFNSLSYLEKPFAIELADVTNPPTMIDKRYGISGAFVAHGAATRGILWVDIQEGTSIVGFIDNSKEATLALTSKFYNSSNVPLRAKQILKKVVDENCITGGLGDVLLSKILFYNIETKQTETLPPSWLGTIADPYPFHFRIN